MFSLPSLLTRLPRDQDIPALFDFSTAPTRLLAQGRSQIPEEGPEIVSTFTSQPP
jgi:hypothetical protein